MVWAATAIAAVSVVGGQVAAHKGRKANRKANALQKQLNQLGNKQSIRAFLKNYRAEQANALAQGVFAGIGLESSSVQGAQSSLRTQAEVAGGEADEMLRLGSAAGDMRLKSAKYNMNAQLFNQAASLATSFIPTAPKEGGGGPEVDV